MKVNLKTDMTIDGTKLNINGVDLTDEQIVSFSIMGDVYYDKPYFIVEYNTRTKNDDGSTVIKRWRWSSGSGEVSEVKSSPQYFGQEMSEDEREAALMNGTKSFKSQRPTMINDNLKRTMIENKIHGA